MPAKMKVFFILSMFILILHACAQPHKKSEKEIPYAESHDVVQDLLEASTELTPEQESAFDALNSLQVSTDEKNRLYSTFAGIDQPCYPPDTSLTISQSAFLMAMKEFVTKNCKNLSVEEREELAAAAVLAQEAYTVALCLGNAADVTYESGVPMTGTWVLPRMLGRRDVIIVW